MRSKKELVFDGNTTDSYQDSQLATILDYSQILFYIKNTGSNALKYKILATPDIDNSPI